MRKWWIVLWGCMSLLYHCKAGAKEDSIVNAARNRSLLWKITGNEMKRPSYIFGTMHLICKDDYIWTATMKKSLKASKEVCFEMDMNDPSLMMEIANGMIDQSGKQLQDYFSPEDYALVTKYFADSLGVDVALIAQLKPVALVSFLASSGLTCSNTISYENRIMQEAEKMKLDITGLEQPTEQMALLERIPTDTIISELMQIVRGGVTNTEDYKNMIEAYRSQDIAQLYQLMADADENRLSLDVFVDDRNIKWIERMEERMDQRPVFFAVGAGHLWGENGIINLLRNKGYKVEAVR